MRGKIEHQQTGDVHDNTQTRLSPTVSNKLTYLLVGGGIGAIVALLFAPKSGNELRTDLADATRKGYDRTRETAQQLGQKSGEYLNTAKQRAGDVYTRAGGALNAAKSEFGKKSDTASIGAGNQPTRQDFGGELVGNSTENTDETDFSESRNQFPA